ncbi:MAG: hypothetical protein GPI97_10070 [Microcystis aeruginosa W13-16]|nr:hypothetical protein [Microcystis aeruginosa W13-16]
MGLMLINAVAAPAAKLTVPVTPVAVSPAAASVAAMVIVGKTTSLSVMVTVPVFVVPTV